MFKKVLKTASVLGAMSLIAVSCAPDNGGDGSSPNALPEIGADGCTSVVVATSSEKVNLMEDLGQKFKESDEGKALDTCATIYPVNVASGQAADNLMNSTSEWPDVSEEYYPTIWSPASTIWTDQVAIVAGQNVYASEPTSFAKTPIVYGMPETMAKALGYPDKDVSMKDLEKLVREGWGSVGKDIWGDFKIAKTNPNTSTTGLSALLMQSYAATNKAKDLTTKDIDSAKDFSQSFETGAIHYGDTTGKVLTTLYNKTQNGADGNYVSAVALEETSLVNYNKGNPDSHVVQNGETLTPPKEKLVAVYPSEGSMWSDNPAVLLNTSWVDENEKTAGEAFLKFLQTDTAQNALAEYGFRSVNDKVDQSKILNAELGVDLSKPATTLPKPDVEVAAYAKDQWVNIRKPSAVLELIDISGSMDDGIGDGRSKLDGAIDSAQGTIGNFRPTDEVGVWAFTTDVSSDLGEGVVPVREFAPLKNDSEKIGTSLDDLRYAEHNGTPLYDSVALSYDYMSERAETGRINAIVVLSDGADEGSTMSLNSLLTKLQASNSSEGSKSAEVRIFTIAYGDGADKETLSKISEATGGQMFDASDPERIEEVFESVINNF